MTKQLTATIDGNEAAATIAHLTNEVICIYPITPSSNMGEWCDEWSSKGQTNLWGTVPEVVEMQSEAGAAGAVHGALQAGARTTTFTASQGLLLKIPNMYKIAGELTPTVFHVSARSLAAQALSIFGDHSDVMSARSTGFAFLASGSVQEVMDMALIAQAASLESRIPFLHFFDGFRTSHEVSKIHLLSREQVAEMIPQEMIDAHRSRCLTPDSPLLRGTAQNPDVYFQTRETINPFYAKLPAIVQNMMDKFAKISGRQYHLFDYEGAPDATTVIVLMGSGIDTVSETVEYLAAKGEKVGVLKCRLFRPFDEASLLAAIPATAERIVALDRCKEPGAAGEPLFKDLVTAVAQNANSDAPRFTKAPKIFGGRYGLSSKEFTPAMVKAIFDEMKKEKPKNGFTIGIKDDVSHTSLDYDPTFRTNTHDQTVQAVFYGLGSDGTVGANKNSIKIIGEETDQYCQGYFVYDSKKSGTYTISHLRFGPKPINTPYLIEQGAANFIGCHMPVFLEQLDMIEKAAPGAVFLLNTHEPQDKIWDTFPKKMQQYIIDKQIKVYTIDAFKVAHNTGMGNRINTIMQTCFFAISGVLPRDEAIDAIKKAVQKTYGKRGDDIVKMNFDAIDHTLENLTQLKIPAQATSQIERRAAVPDNAPEFVKNVLGKIISGHGDELPVSAFTVDGTFPTATTQYEKRNIALEIPVWEPDLCIQCGKCTFVCPHACLRSKIMSPDVAASAPAAFKTAPLKGSKDFPEDTLTSYQLSPEDCTGCGLCAEVCPSKDKTNPERKALNMTDYTHDLRVQENQNWEFFFNQVPDVDRSLVKQNTVKGVSLLRPLFEFSGACTGCGETPYVRLTTQLYGDRMLIANATGCSSIYGGNLPTTPYSKDACGRGPTWINSLFEDNAEFGMGMRVAVDRKRQFAIELLQRLEDKIGGELVSALIQADQSSEPGIFEQRKRIELLKEKIKGVDSTDARDLMHMADYLAKKSVWMFGGDGWAYDIGFGGLDHVIASDRDVNLLVMDTEVYSNTGGQTSKATPKGAVAKFSAGGKPTNKKDLAQIAMTYGHVYVAQVAYGANDNHTLKAIQEAESYPGPSVVIAYAPCIAHGQPMINNHAQQRLAVSSGHWMLFRYDPRLKEQGKNPLQLDSKEPSTPYIEFLKSENRFNMLWQANSELADTLAKESQKAVRERYEHYLALASDAFTKK
jgi:pyruvate-ferredoxin/flavodoxin oxidoreductase